MIINTQMLLQPSISLSIPHPVPLQAVLGPVPAQQLDRLHVASADLALPAVVPNPHAGEFVSGTVFQLAARRRASSRTLNVSRKFITQAVPDIDSRPFFSNNLNVKVHRVFVRLNKLTFVVYGYNDSRYPRNMSIAKIKRTTIWRGELAVFVVGKRKAFPTHTRVPAATIDRVASLFVSRVTEALDFGIQIPFLIDFNFA